MQDDMMHHGCQMNAVALLSIRMKYWVAVYRYVMMKSLASVYQVVPHRDVKFLADQIHGNRAWFSLQNALTCLAEQISAGAHIEPDMGLADSLQFLAASKEGYDHEINELRQCIPATCQVKHLAWAYFLAVQCCAESAEHRSARKWESLVRGA